MPTPLRQAQSKQLLVDDVVNADLSLATYAFHKGNKSYLKSIRN